MDSLKELVYVINKNKLRAIELMSLPMNSQSKLGELYDLIAEGNMESTDELADHFYPNDTSGASFRKLKANLKNRLINTLFFIDIKQPSFNDYQKAYYECYKDWAATKILMGRNAHTAAVELSQRTLKYAEMYEFTALKLDIYKTLRMHYASKGGSQKKFNKYNTLYKKCFRTFEVESQAEELYSELILHYVNDKSSKEIIYDRAEEAYEQLKPALAEHDSYNLHLYASLIRLMIYTSVNDYEGAIVACDDAIHFFENKPFNAHVPLQIFYYQELVCFTQLRQFERGSKVAEKCLELIEEGSYNWFKYQELYMILSLHTEQYQRAYEVFLNTVEHSRFQFLPDSVTEMWKIFEAYIHYLIEVEKIVTPEGDNRFNKFRLGRFLNETPIFSKDKRGMNVAILVIQILFQILKRKYNDAIDRIEAVEKYSSRYLHQEDTFRSNCFIKILLTIPMSSFHKAAVLRKAEPYLKKLESSPFEVSNQSIEVEIIPFEKLWQFALESLENKFYKRRGGR